MQVLATLVVAAVSLLGLVALLIVTRSGGAVAAGFLVPSRCGTLALVTSDAPSPNVACARALPPRAPPVSLHRNSLAQLAACRE